jgi:hypothetical protein
MTEEMFPVSLSLEESLRSLKCSSLKTEGGIWPCNLLKLRLIYCNELQRNGLIWPYNRLLFKRRKCNEGMENKEDGIVPLSKL